MTLNAIGESECAQCGTALELEAELVPTKLLCPRGCGALSAAADVFECVRCGGLFVSKEALAGLVDRHQGAAPRASFTPPAPAPDHVTYLPCPTCNVRMNRTVFGRSSGVIVDVCKAHGTWFDARELTASLAFVERGGLALVAKREAERKAEEARQREVDRRTAGFEGATLSGSRSPLGGDTDLITHTEVLRGLIDILLSL
jgi:Zn-finger nucleic acid-binding protein